MSTIVILYIVTLLGYGIMFSEQKFVIELKNVNFYQHCYMFFVPMISLIDGPFQAIYILQKDFRYYIDVSDVDVT